MRGSAAFRVAVAPGGALAGPWVQNSLWTAARAVPSLDLRFADNKSLVDAVTGAQLVTFTRASSGTYVDSEGLIRTATTNLQTNSENIASLGTLTGSTVTSNTIVAPDGQTTADKLIEDTSTGGHQVSGISISWLGNTTYTVSVYAKADTRTVLTVAFGTASNWVNSSRTAAFNLSSGTVSSTSGTPLVASIQALPNGWYRCIVSATTVAAPVASTLVLQLNNGSTTSYTGDGTSGLFLWGAQLEQSTTVGEYIPTTSTINSAPRFDHNPTTGESLGLLVEEARTNLVRNNTMVGAVAGSPGTPPTNGWVIVNNATHTSSILGTGTENGINYIDIQYVVAAAAPAATLFYCDTPAASALTAYTGSYYLKLISGTIPQVRFIWQDGVSTYNKTFFTLTATLTRYTDTLTTAILANLARFAVGIDAAPSGATFVIRVGLPQVEQGAFATSPILTSTATVTRAADVASITGTNLSSWYRQDEGTVFVDNTNYGVSNTRIVSFSDNSTNNRFTVARGTGSSGNINTTVTVGGVAQVNSLVLASSLSFGSAAKAAVAIKASDFAGSANGLAPVTQTTGSMPTTFSQVTIGNGEILGTNTFSGTLRRFTYWPIRLGSEVLPRITQP